ncbi:nucleotidyltransferase family protein [Geothrix fermentans]|uniref:nucleotidyltransferase family protein n=1 Tax=Geothrix fermentans TaxID=44676 RepID=UPI00041AD8BE|nr:nucleotidyltransferase family protein [Geothrix fermentans]
MTAALVLAAGAGRRMGGPKALLTIAGETLLHRAARAALGAGCRPVLAVTGAWDPGLEGLAVGTVPNPGAEEGMASSIRVGIAALPAAQSVLLLTVDQLAVDEVLLRRLLALAATDPSRPAACAYAGTVGIPAVLPRRLFPELLALRGDRGAKALLLRESAATLPFPEGAADLDTPEDLRR